VISNIDPSNQIFLAGVDQIQQRIAAANQQISSGLKISVASDAPDALGDLLQLRTNYAMNSQMQENLNVELTNAQTADGSLGSAIQLMDSATQIAASAANSTNTADTRNTLAQQVQALLSQMVDISQTQVQGSYIFSGDENQNPSYQLDPNAANGVDQLSNPSATRQIQNPEGGTFLASQTAQQIFDSQNPDGSPGQNNVFAALNNLRRALLNNDGAGITAAQTMIQQASSHLNDAQAFYGNVENQIQNASSYSTSYSTQLQTQIGNIQDADIPSAAEALTEANTQLQAAFQAEAKSQMPSLFSYLG
jgi:flagellar hook-associated protein 3 FlgL